MDRLLGPRRPEAERPRALRPGYQAALAGLLAVLLAAFAWDQMRAARRTVRGAMETDAVLRIGLSAAALQVEERRAGTRLAVLGGLLAVLGVVGVGLVTVRQNYSLLDEEYARMQVYSRRILEQMTDAVVATDPAGRIQVFNQAAERLFGVRAGQALDRTCREILGRDVSVLEQTLHSGEEVQGRVCRCHLPDGRGLVLPVSTSLIRTQGGAVETGVAHEVRNPLNAIGLIAQRLEREFAPAAAPEEYLGLARTVRGQVERANRIVQQFLRFARMPALVLEEHDLDAVVADAVRVVEPRARQKGLAVAFSLGGAGRVLLDREQIEQALLNLLNNAVEATASGGIRVTTRGGADWAEVDVEDTGPGIAAGDLERIFDLYFTTKPEGTGLGMSLVHRIVSEHNGRVEVRSDPGNGAAFRLRLPRGAQHAS